LQKLFKSCGGTVSSLAVSVAAVRPLAVI